ncbi:hypothetical protein HELRODRAFT_98923 [Helobdella robusta]|uniref:Gamma-secretase subunit Aph-1 n=1 Tax=Helobdella robusta TaxID=6412 RepID=T1G9Q4_HELRO|nr:hypothetical protein HELRODRAFT_98923 [Helobdella robusta]ESO05470.1 hypothetical protein HELRODRAFT_98923 [Helobdella robusta]
MSMVEFLGCFLITIGPVLVLFFMTIAHDPILVILCIARLANFAFFWMLSLLVSSAWWLFFDVIIFKTKSVVGFGVVFAVLFQEMFRFLLFKLMKKAEHGLKTVWRSDSLFVNDNQLAYVAGLGFGSIHCIFNMVNLLAAMFGPGTAGLRGHSYDFFITSSFLSLGFLLLNILWGIIFFHGFRWGLYHQPVIVLISHFMVSACSILSFQFGVAWSIMLTLAMVISMAFYTYKVLGGSWQLLKRSFKFTEAFWYPSSSSSSTAAQPEDKAE